MKTSFNNAINVSRVILFSSFGLLLSLFSCAKINNFIYQDNYLKSGWEIIFSTGTNLDVIKLSSQKIQNVKKVDAQIQINELSPHIETGEYKNTFYAKNQSPNILIITVDNLGYGDLHIYNKNSPIKTPNIDRFCSSRCTTHKSFIRLRQLARHLVQHY